MYIQSLLSRKASVIYPEMTLQDAAKALSCSSADGLPVVDGKGKLVGLFTKTNLANAAAGDEFHQRRVKDFMERKIFSLHTSATLKGVQQGYFFSVPPSAVRSGQKWDLIKVKTVFLL